LASALTARSIESMKPGNARREVPDAHMPGLYLIVQPSGAKSWAVRYRFVGKPRKHTLGPYPRIDLKVARELGAKALRSAAEGRDLAEEKKQKAQAADDSVEAIVERFIERHLKRNYRPKPLKEAQRLLRVHIVAAWPRRPIGSITSKNLRDMLEKIVASGAPIVANRVHSIVRKFFNWCLENEIVAVSPCAGVKRPAAEASRDRVLTDAELKQVWQAADTMGFPFGPMVQLLILTGQRRGEVAGMQWAELDLDNALWVLPRERVKNDRRHEVPLAQQAVTIIEQLPRIVGSPLVFTLNGSKTINGFGKDKERIDKLAGVAGWTVHDLRRTCASGLAKMGVSLPVIEKILNHVSGSFAGVAGIYRRHDFADEKRDALQRWAYHVELLVADQPAKVIPLRGAQ
jgi:integrase